MCDCVEKKTELEVHTLFQMPCVPKGCTVKHVLQGFCSEMLGNAVYWMAALGSTTFWVIT